MEHDRFRGQASKEPFYTDLEEFAGRPPADAATAELAVRNAMVTIGALMREERAKQTFDAFPEIEGQQSRRTAATGGASDLLRRMRPAPVIGAWAALFVAVLIWPRAVLIAMLAVFVLCLVGVALFGEARLRRMLCDVELRARAALARVRRSWREPDPFEDYADPFERLERAPSRDSLGS
jgi:Flp pilus assembly protein TadB